MLIRGGDDPNKSKKAGHHRRHLNVLKYLAFSLSDVVFIMLINVKTPTIVGI